MQTTYLLQQLGVDLVIALGVVLEVLGNLALLLLGQQCGRPRPPAELEELIPGHPTSVFYHSETMHRVALLEGDERCRACSCLLNWKILISGHSASTNSC